MAMPRKIDAGARRGDVVEALFRVAVREGLPRVSLRTVAAEAQLNIGSLRHYFSTQQELMELAMRAMIDRVQARVAERAEHLRLHPAQTVEERLRWAQDVLSELLPVDGTRRAEVMIFLDFVVFARTKPEFRGLAVEVATRTRKFVHRVLVHLGEHGTLRDGLDLDIETERLTSLLDGLSLNAVLYPELLPARRCLSTLRAQLDALAATPEHATRHRASRAGRE